MNVLKSIPAVAVKVRLGFRRIGDEPRGGIRVCCAALVLQPHFVMIG